MPQTDEQVKLHFKIGFGNKEILPVLLKSAVLLSGFEV